MFMRVNKEGYEQYLKTAEELSNLAVATKASWHLIEDTYLNSLINSAMLKGASIGIVSAVGVLVAARVLINHCTTKTDQKDQV